MRRHRCISNAGCSWNATSNSFGSVPAAGTATLLQSPWRLRPHNVKTPFWAFLMKSGQSTIPAIPSRRLFTSPRPGIASSLSNKGHDITRHVRMEIARYFFLTPAKEFLFSFPEHCGVVDPRHPAQLFPSAHHLPCRPGDGPTAQWSVVSILTTQTGLIESTTVEGRRNSQPLLRFYGYSFYFYRF